MNENNKLKPFDVLLPLAFVLIMWVVELIEVTQDLDFGKYGIKPRSVENFIGIFTSPFIHSDWEHLINNSIPMFFLGIAIFYFFRKVAVKVYLLSMLVTGIWVWVFARNSFHIGASGIVYSFASFLFFSGFFAKNYRMLSISFLIVFLYGSMIWGILPYDYRISWESHLMGALSGGLLAYFYRGFGPKRKVYDYELEDEDELGFNEDETFFDKSLQSEANENVNRNSDDANEIVIKYHVKPSNRNEPKH